ncbi:MAG: hypothetical protein AABY16_01420 [Nanoarchaeota archaeon]
MAADVSAFAYFLPILAFLIVFAIMLAVLHKTKLLGENIYVQLFFSFVIATIFVTATSVRQLVINVLPWFAVLLIALFLLMVLIGFMGKTDVMIGKCFGWIFVIFLIIIFLISGVKVFSGTIGPYIPGSTTAGTGDPTLTNFFEWLFSPRVGGAVLLIIVAALVSWVLVKTGGMKGK